MDITKIEEFTKGISKDKFDKDVKLQDAIVRRIEIIGEAVKNIPDSFRKKHPGILWKEIAGMRDIITHSYFRVDLDAIWQVVRKDLPELKTQISQVLKQES